MSTEKNETPTVETTPVETAPVETTEKKAKKPREKVRTVEELQNIPYNKMSDKEKHKIYEYHVDTIATLSTKVEAYKQNAEAAFAQTRQVESQYKAMEKYYRDLLKYVDSQLNAFHAAINQAIKGGVE